LPVLQPTIIPPIIVLLAQRYIVAPYIVQGLTLGAVKG